MSNAIIRPIRASDMIQIGEVHRMAFPHSGLTPFGADVLRQYYEWQIRTSPGLKGAVAESSGIIVGYCLVGGAYGSLASFIRSHPGLLLGRVLTRPWLLFDRRFFRGFSYVARRLRKMLRSRAQKNRSAGMVNTSFGVQAIAVSPSHARNGAGRALMNWAEQTAAQLGFQNIYLAVNTANTPAIHFYEGLGWTRVTKGDFWNGHMKKAVEDTSASVSAS